MDANGDFVVTWYGTAAGGGGLDIYAQRYNSAGIAQGSEFRVNTYLSDSQYQQDVAMDADGDFVVAWTSFGQDGSDTGIYAQRYNASGIAQGSEFRVNTYTSSGQGSPSIAMDASGDFVVAWESQLQDGDGSGVYAQRYDAAGNPQGGEFLVNTSTTDSQGSAEAAMDADGDFVVVWDSKGLSFEVFCQRYNAAGIAQGSEFVVNSETAGTQGEATVSMDADGDFVVAWHSNGQDGDGFGVYAQRFSALGISQGAEFRVNTYTIGSQSNPAAEMDADGDFVVTWESDIQDGSGRGVYAQAFEAGGNPRGSEFRVNAYTSSHQRDPRIAMEDNGDFVVTWSSDGQDGDGLGVYAQRYEDFDNPPTISDIVDQMADANDTIGPIAFTVNDAETAPGSLIVTAQSNNQTLVPNGNITIDNLGGMNRQITIVPAANESGMALITVTVDDGTNTSFDTFEVTFNNTTPTISDIANQGMPEDETLGPIAFTVGDAETPAGSLIVTAVSNNQAIVPNANISIGNLGGGNRQITIEPAADANGGPVLITVTVDDGSTSSQDTFDVNVTAVNDGPEAVADFYHLPIDDQLVVASPGVRGNDIDIDTPLSGLVAELVSDDTAGGTLVSFGADGSFEYHPDPGFEGSDTFTYRISDGEFWSDPVTVTIDIIDPSDLLFVDRVIPTGPSGEPFDRLEIVFNQAVVDGTFTLSDVSFGVHGGADITPLALTKITSTRYELVSDGLTGLGIYRLDISEDITDVNGFKMDHDHDVVTGEAGDDDFNAALFSITTTIADATFDDLHLVFDGTTFTVDGTHPFGSASLYDNAAVRHSASTASEEFRLDWTLVDDLYIEAGSSIDVSGRGYLAGRTLGNTTVGGATSTNGGSYAGLGGGTTPNTVYGDFRNPNELGAGGGGSSGGGLVRITAHDAVIDGLIRANGASTSNGRGAGGGIRLDFDTLSGSGTISANGGGAGSSVGGGGGGRVALYYEDASGFDLANDVTAHGGTSAAGTLRGAVGTVYLAESGEPDVLLIDSHGAPTAGYTPLGVAGDTQLAVDRLIIRGSGVIASPEHQMPIVAQDVSILSGAMLTHLTTTATQEYSLLMTLSGTLTVDATSSVDVSGRGYLAGRTLGNTTVGGATSISGGSYGGLGGGTTPNTVYGDFRNPNELGAGGGGSSGGGLVRITASHAVIDGIIRANGASTSNGRGAGGGIRLDIDSLSGGGTISANGGGAATSVGGGGGGRVALYYEDASGFDLANNATAHGGTSTSSTLRGAVGTIYLAESGEPDVLLIDSHGAPVAGYTPLGVAGDTQLAVDRLIIRGSGVIAAPEHQMPIVAQDVTLESGAMLTHLATTATQEYSLLVTLSGTLTVGATSSIDVSGRGYLAGYTLGNTTVGGATGTGGGSYGGLGGGTTPNAMYGDFTNPNELGSGGSGSSGGGLVRITASDAVIDGVIRANGASTSNGRGAGGGIRLDVDTLSGSGTISANGAGASTSVGAGGGGRVAIYYCDTISLPAANVTANGGNSTPSSLDGQPGTVHIAPCNDNVQGDYNRNGVVDAADYVTWRKTLGTTGVPAFSGADGDGDGMITQADYVVWTAHFGETVGVGAGQEGARSKERGASESQGSRIADFGLRIGGSQEGGAGNNELIRERQGTLTLALSQRERGFQHDALMAWVATRARGGISSGDGVAQTEEANEESSADFDAALDAAFEELVAM
jgi:hypothetical protein